MGVKGEELHRLEDNVEHHLDSFSKSYDRATNHSKAVCTDWSPMFRERGALTFDP